MTSTLTMEMRLIPRRSLTLIELTSEISLGVLPNKSTKEGFRNRRTESMLIERPLASSELLATLIEDVLEILPVEI